MLPDNVLPRYLPLKRIAAHITATRFPVSPRTMERWSLTIRIINGKRHAETQQALALADRMIAEAPPVAIGSPLYRASRWPKLASAESQNELGRPAKAAPLNSPRFVNTRAERDGDTKCSTHIAALPPFATG
jgi:hypothetical protein